MKRILTIALAAALLLSPVIYERLHAQGGAWTYNHNSHYFVAADQTFNVDANLHNITGLSLPMPNLGVATFLAVQCHLVYSQATAGAANIYGVQFVTNGPTNSVWYAAAQTSVAATGVFAATAPATITNNSATTLTTATPGAITTLYGVEIHGFVEWPASTSGTLNIMAGTGAMADALTVKRDSFCFFPGQ